MTKRSLLLPDAIDVTEASVDEAELALDQILARLATTDKDSLARIRQAQEEAGLERIVTEAQPESAIAESSPSFGDQAEHYTITLPGYAGGQDSYKADYVAAAVEANDDLTEARYDAEPDDEVYEAALEAAEKAHDKTDHGGMVTFFDLDMDTRERQRMYKLTHPLEWSLMSQSRQMLQLFRMF
jgi:hypothetical protein